ncbi:hypothetical protein [Pseudonocardia humida]|uniref:DUF4352 domain-containing protein n=1 Tax=Pseudonocardia humida TaxID=2800819 RepID=A0ABT1A562_9PSEU|nr:hypothetical protein [Pseudonocardia humida]MCO1658068.1 hypothetical protein [Pseudonocardia humida]
MSIRGVRLLVVLVAGLALVGCTQAVGGGGASADGPATAAGEPVAELPVLSSRYAVDETDGQPVAVRVDLNEVRVIEQVLQVTFTARNTNAPARGDAPPGRWQVADFFGDGVAAADALDAVDGVYVVDPVHTTRHLPGRNPDGQCLCSGGLTDVSVLPGDGAVLTATFAAPTPDVQVVNVHVPRVGEFTGVRVER